MDLADLQNLDIDDIPDWPIGARIGIILVLCGLVLGAGYYFDTQHRLIVLDETKAREEQLKRAYAVKQAKAINLDSYKEQLEEMRRSFGTMLRQLPSKAEVADLLVDISQTGLANNLEFQLFRPGAERQEEFYATLPIELRVVGQYHDFGQFISDLAALPRIVTLHDIRIMPLKEGGLIMEATAKTYRYLDTD